VNTMGKVHQLFVYFKKAYDSVSRDVLHNIVTEYDITMELVSLIDMCLNETHGKVRISKNLSDAFLI